MEKAKMYTCAQRTTLLQAYDNVPNHYSQSFCTSHERLPTPHPHLGLTTVPTPLTYM